MLGDEPHLVADEFDCERARIFAVHGFVLDRVRQAVCARNRSGDRYDISNPDGLAYPIKYDSVNGKYPASLTVEFISDEVWLQVGACWLPLIAERYPEGVPWKVLNV